MIWLQRTGINANCLEEGTVAIAIGDSLKLVNSQRYAVHDQAAATTATVNSFAYAITANATGAGNTITGNTVFLTGAKVQI
jgi:hypothetical protein